MADDKPKPRLTVIRNSDPAVEGWFQERLNPEVIPWPGANREWFESIFPRKYRPHVGAECLCCGTWTEMYRNTIGVRAHHGLVSWYRDHGTEWASPVRGRQNSSGVPTYKITDQSTLPWWGLMERRGWGSKTREQRVTDLGVQWLKGEIGVPKYAVHVLSHFLWFEEGQTGRWFARDAQKKKFDLDLFLAGEL